MTENPFRLIIPIALINGKIRHHTGRNDFMVMKALFEALRKTDGQVSSLSKLLHLPEGMITALICSATRKGYLSLCGERLQLSNNCVDALENDKLESFLGMQTSRESCNWAMDLATGILHDYNWVLDHRKTVAGITDINLEQEIPIDKIPAILRELNIRDLARNSSACNNFRNKKTDNAAKSITVESVDGIEEIQYEETIEVAIPFEEHTSGEISRWLLQDEAPSSIINCLIQKKPEIFKTQYALKEGLDKWTPCQATVLLERIDRLWEAVQNAPLRHTSKQLRKELAIYAQKEIKRWRSCWIPQTIPYSDTPIVDLWSGPASKQFQELHSMLKYTNKRIVILTSFLNRKHASYVAEVLSSLPQNTSVLILYGHANSETLEEQNAELHKYENELLQYLRKDIILNVAVTTKKTHEKIIVDDSSNCVIGSWNLCSSNPDSNHLEVNIRIRSNSLASKLCSILKNKVNEPEASFLKSLEETLEKTNGYTSTSIEKDLNWLSDLMESIVKEPDDEFSIIRWKDWREQLLGLRDILWTYFYSPPISLVETESLRDEFVRQIRSSTSSILIATDRVNYNALDVSITKHLLEKQRLIRIVWGMEDPQWTFDDDPEVREELQVATETLQPLLKHGNGEVLTSLKPMLNHSKVLVIDENRVIISSYNFLAKGNEPNEETSQEIGVLLESPLIARKLLGQFMLHSKSICGRVELRKRAGYPWDLFELTKTSSSRSLETWKSR